MTPSALESVPYKVVGHYTQVVWADTYEVGCGYVAYKPQTGWGPREYVSIYLDKIIG